MSNRDHNNLLSAPEAAAALNCHPSLVRRYCQQGRLPGAFKIGNRWVIPRDALDQFASLPRKVGRPKEKHVSR